ncbi:metal ABC transporter solute-binding protein, Zn/Mn family [Nocardia callitridis]
MRLAAITLGATTALTLTACAGSEDSGKPSVVASTDVWGNIAETIAGSDAEVESLISDPSADPHSHETSAVESADLSDADLVVYNGGGYDEFVEKALAGGDQRTVSAFDARPDKNDENEHVFYDTRTVATVADQIARSLSELDPEHAADYTGRATTFKDKLGGIDAIAKQVATAHPRTPILQTEPLAHYLLRTAGTDDRTPHDFQEAIEQETDPAPATVAATRNLLTDKQVRALVYNVQTQDKITQDLRAVAEKANIPVLEVTETLPEGVDYIQWQTTNAQALAAALA